MARKTSTVPTKIWTFSTQAPNEAGHEVVKDQLWKAHGYYNRLIEIERERRKGFRDYRRKYVPLLGELEDKYAAIQEAIEEARRELKALSQQARQKVEAPDGLKARIAELLRESKAHGKALKVERARTKEHLDKVRERLETELDALGAEVVTEDELDALCARVPSVPGTIVEFAVREHQLRQASYQAIREARAANGLYWGTYLLIEEAAKVACKSPSDPRFKRFDGSGRIGVQIQKGMTTAQLFGGMGTQLQIDPIPAESFATRSGRRHAYSTVRIRVGSKGRAPIWASFPVLVHREIPEGLIKGAWILVRRCGVRTYYSLQLVIESPTFAEKDRGKGTVALDIGWRSLPKSGNLRVAYWVDAKGKHGSLELPKQLREQLALCQALRGFADTHFEVAKKVFNDWLRLQSKLPEWLTEATQHLGHWHQARRLAMVVYQFAAEYAPDHEEVWAKWRDERLAHLPKLDLFAPFDEIVRWLRGEGITNKRKQMALYLTFWRRKNGHLFDWEAHQRARFLRARANLYNEWANWLVRTYDTIVLEDFDLRQAARRVNPEEEDDFAQAVRYNRQVAAVSELRLAIKERAQADAIILLPSVNSTITCRQCRHVEDFDKAKELVHTCPACNRTWDQDKNAADNLLYDVMTNDPNGPKAPRESPGGSKGAGGTRKKAKTGTSRAKSSIAGARLA